MRYELDARRMLCPMPVIKAQNKIKDLAVGDILDIFCTDPGALNDIPAWARINGHVVLETSEQDGDIVVTVQVNE